MITFQTVDAKQNNRRFFLRSIQFGIAKKRRKNYSGRAKGPRMDHGIEWSGNVGTAAGTTAAAAAADDDTNIVEMSIDSKHRKGGIVLFELI